MTTPPAGQEPHGDQPPPGFRPPGPLPPSGAPQPQYPASPPPRRKPISAGAAVGGALTYFIVSFFLGFFLIGASDRFLEFDNSGFVVAAVVFALIAFGGGAALMRSSSPGNRGFGLGLMIGWALASVCTLGICTGINPTLYTS